MQDEITCWISIFIPAFAMHVIAYSCRIKINGQLSLKYLEEYYETRNCFLFYRLRWFARTEGPVDSFLSPNGFIVAFHQIIWTSTPCFLGLAYCNACVMFDMLSITVSHRRFIINLLVWACNTSSKRGWYHGCWYPGFTLQWRHMCFMAPQIICNSIACLSGFF